MAFLLPPSLQKDLHPVREEVAWARRLSPEERLEVVAAVCRDALTLLAMNPRRDELLSMRDPVPPSTIEAFGRLRARS